MKKNYLEIKENLLETVEDMIDALLEVPKEYILNPLGQQCIMAVNHYDKCIHLDDPHWIDSFEYELKEEIESNGDNLIIDVPDEELKTFAFGYVWYETSETDGTYSYFKSVKIAENEYNKISDLNKTYGIAQFIDGKLEPVKVLCSTL